MIVVSDTSAITALMQVEMADILPQLYGEVIIPKEVETELRRFHATIPEFIRVVPVADQNKFLKFCTEVDVGEAAAITLMLEGRADLLLMDERRGRQIARREGINFVGLIGVLLEAKWKGIIPSMTGAIRLLEERADFRISQALKTRAIASAGEN